MVVAAWVATRPMLWRHYPDTTSLDRQFTLDGIRDLRAVMKRRLDLSAQAQAEAPNRLGVRYGERPEATLDLFFPPKGREPRRRTRRLPQARRPRRRFRPSSGRIPCLRAGW